MREIKFRAWSDISKKYHYQGNSELWVYLRGVSGMILEQLTGLKDKNGVHIYEGDYLVDRFPIDDEDLSQGYNERLLPVMWCNKKSCWCIDVTFAKNGERLEPIYSYFGDHLEVKGNIHTTNKTK